jgi:hypothetical protein
MPWCSSPWGRQAPGQVTWAGILPDDGLRGEVGASGPGGPLKNESGREAELGQEGIPFLRDTVRTSQNWRTLGPRAGSRECPLSYQTGLLRRCRISRRPPGHAPLTVSGKSCHPLVGALTRATWKVCKRNSQRCGYT